MAPQRMEGATGAAQTLCEGFDGMDSGCIDRRHIAQTEDDDGRKNFEVGGGVHHLFGVPKKNGPWLRSRLT